ncbi:hypothetical protein PV10_03486 [Exophiala mesophila]|uniref:EKC/KEOPS complex subunit CGI121 n=1 Tax=Exophiala mesophila TaxID=212818 RepID=A0A0D1X289_EXOME|nr:uncharacterized protein PV10_03486 [Exophiala mesophila]KIV95885.1 hypothetical protein PV10_03486 [Exophiala mesophila]
MVQTVQIAHMPPDLVLHVGLYRDLTNAGFLRDQLLAGNAEFEYAFIDASMIVSTKHVLAATFRTLNDYLNERLKSRNVHSEIVFALSPNNNIGEAFRRFGISETTKNLLVIKVATSPAVTLESVTSHLNEHIKGTQVVFDDASFNSLSDIGRIKKVYKLTSPTSGKVNGVANRVQGAGERHLDFLESQILGSIALRGAT